MSENIEKNISAEHTVMFTIIYAKEKNQIWETGSSNCLAFFLEKDLIINIVYKKVSVDQLIN